MNKLAEKTLDIGLPAVHSAQVPAARVETTPMDMLASAVDRGLAPETISQLMTLEERWTANKGRRAFDQAVAEVKAHLPAIIKNRTGHNDRKYADFAAIAKTIDPVLSEHGLGYRFTTEQDEKTIRVTCVLFHRDGHSERTTLAGPADNSGNKNAIQAIGSTLTYLQRYSLTQMLGLAASEDDDGKAAGDGELIDPQEQAKLQALLMEHDIPLAKFFKVMKIENLADLPVRDLPEANRQIQEVIAARATRKREAVPA